MCCTLSVKVHLTNDLNSTCDLLYSKKSAPIKSAYLALAKALEAAARRDALVRLTSEAPSLSMYFRLKEAYN